MRSCFLVKENAVVIHDPAKNNRIEGNRQDYISQTARGNLCGYLIWQNQFSNIFSLDSNASL